MGYRLLSRRLDTTEVNHIALLLIGLSLFYFHSSKFSPLTSHFEIWLLLLLSSFGHFLISSLLPLSSCYGKDSLQTHNIGLKWQQISGQNNNDKNQVRTSHHLIREKEKINLNGMKYIIYCQGFEEASRALDQVVGLGPSRGTPRV